jgi:3-hydroxyisobutyrate dehydrogenase-like beta-hydroxyacid dehydrogenase
MKTEGKYLYADSDCIFFCLNARVTVSYRIVVQERVGPVKEGRTVLDCSSKITMSLKPAKNRK